MPAQWSSHTAGYSGVSRMSVNRRIRVVAPAATDREVNESYDGYTIRSMVASELKPRSSARRAQATMSDPETVNVLGSPMPISMLPTLPGTLRRGAREHLSVGDVDVPVDADRVEHPPVVRHQQQRAGIAVQRGFELLDRR